MVAQATQIAVIETSKGTIECQLFDKDAPNTVANFTGLATGTKEYKDLKTGQTKKSKYYDGLIFHRVIPNFMIQGGDPTASGRGGPGYKFEDELKGSYKKHQAGSLSMANAGPNTNGSQFFITHVATDWLDGKHTVFGQVRSGKSVVDAVKQGDQLISVRIEEA